jgi:hypothetical protein
MVVIAVSKTVLKPVVEPVAPPGLATLAPGLIGAERLTRFEGSTLTFILFHGACDTDIRAHVLEFQDLVVIGGSHGPGPAGVACPLVELSKTVDVALAAPLGDRVVISAATGVRLTPRR